VTFPSKSASFLTSQSQPILLALDKPLEDRDLHVQLDLDVLQVLILLQLIGQLVQETLDLAVLGSHLGPKLMTLIDRLSTR